MPHEGGHWAALQIGGRDPVFGFTGLVQLWDREPAAPDRWVAFTDPNGDRGWLRLGSLPDTTAEWAVFIAAGPFLQLMAVIVGLVLNSLARRQTTRLFGLLLALINSFGQFTYQVIAQIRGSGGDENLLAYYLGVPRAVISILLTAAFAVGLVWAFKSDPIPRSGFKLAQNLPRNSSPSNTNDIHGCFHNGLYFYVIDILEVYQICTVVPRSINVVANK
ncbi:MAG: hypothetical protein ACM3X6_11135 [Patescibacteria group bacterium]